MNIIFCLPSINRLATGGNIYNQKIIKYLSKEFFVTKIVIDDNSLQYCYHQISKEKNDTNDTFFIIDSLLMRNETFLTYLKMNKNTGNLILLVHYLHLLNPKCNDWDEIEKELYNLQIFKGFITTSLYSKDILINYGFYKNICLAKPGLSNVFRENTPKHPQNPEISLLTVANIVPGKGLLETISLLEGLQDLNWRWELVGETQLDKEYFRMFLKQLQKSVIASRVKILGRLGEKELLRKYDTADIFILPSQFESCSMVTMEAMARELPVLVFRVGGIPELFNKKKYNYIITTGDYVAFSDALRTLIVNRIFRSCVRKITLENSSCFHDWKETTKIIKNFLKYLHSLN